MDRNILDLQEYLLYEIVGRVRAAVSLLPTTHSHSLPNRTVNAHLLLPLLTSPSLQHSHLRSRSDELGAVLSFGIHPPLGSHDRVNKERAR